jgi:D-lactate dehydrogenase
MITGKYKEFYNELLKQIPSERMHHDALSTLAFGTDASFYRLIPKLVVKVKDEKELQLVVRLASKFDIPVTFRAQDISFRSGNQRLCPCFGNTWMAKASDYRKRRENTSSSWYQRRAGKQYLERYSRKIGPDPASLDSAMIGGICRQ